MARSPGSEIRSVKTISVIQLGDVHFPEAKEQLVGDLKDSALSGTLRDAIATKKLKLVFSELDRVKNARKPCGLMICGDLTTFGDIAQYAECVAYLTKNARLNDPHVSPRESWHVVPGNHDVARRTLEPNAAPFPELFYPLVAEWKKDFEPSALTFDNLRASRIQHDDCAIQLYSLNSCIGCGEWRRIPEKVRNPLAKQIETLLSNEPDKNVTFETIAEQLDAPAFLDFNQAHPISSFPA
ncbi:MAG: hypothetical protein EXS05_19140 [Planctomycetaceae bacterium]|nr:hypothetical protein [Planctomycetaceae bacterium]